MKTITISPSDLSYFWKDSPRGFYDKYAHRIYRPRMPFPQTFNAIDRSMKEVFEGKSLNKVHPGLPKAKIANADRWTISKPIAFPKHDIQLIIKGKVDSTLEFEDGSFGVVDFKATNLPAEHLKELYKWQLHAYAYALTQNDPKELHLSPIERLGLICYQPESMIVENQVARLDGKLEWIEMELDKKGFGNFLQNQLLPIILLEKPPKPTTEDDVMWENYILNFAYEESEEE